METGSYPSFVGGISQQDASIRNPSQSTDSLNTWLHAAMGAGKRPPSQFVMQMAHDLTGMEHYHSILRDSTERYLVVIGNRSIRVFNHETGHEYQVVIADPAFLDYLATDSQPWSVFRTASSADATMIVNTGKVTAMSGRKSPGVIVGYRNLFTELPEAEKNEHIPINGIYEIRGVGANAYDNYCVQYQGSGIWLEVSKPGSLNEFNKHTMPHVLRRVPDEVHGDGMFFTFGPQDWGMRLAGDENTITPPSFIGERIRDVFFHQGRLGFLSTENCALSEIDHPFNFWRATTTQILDSDVVDFAIETAGVAQLQFAIPYQSSVLLFGDRMNFQMTAEPYLTPKTPVVSPLVNYECSRFVRPVLLGDSLYAVSDTGTHATLREYFVDDVSVTGDAADVTAHVPRLIPTKVRAMATSPMADMVFVSPAQGDTHIYAYHVRWAGDEKTQSSWARWNLSGVGRVVHMRVVDEFLYVVSVAPQGGVELSRIALSLTSSDGDFVEDSSFLLDRLTIAQPQMATFGGFTKIPLPYVLTTLDNVSVIRTDDWAEAGTLVPLNEATLTDGGTTIRIPGDYAVGRLAVGMNYDCAIELSRPYLRDGQGNAVIVGRLQIRDIQVSYNSAAFFEVEVTHKGRGTHPQTYLASHAGLFTSRTLDDEMFQLTRPSFDSGDHRFPVLSRSDACTMRLVNRLPYQCWFQSAQYRALFATRSKI